MSRKTCRYGKLKHPKGNRRCKKRPSRKVRGSKRARRSSRRGSRAMKLGGGALALLALGGAGVYYWTQNQPPA